MFERYKDAYAGAFLSIFSALYLWFAGDIRQTKSVGARTLPLFFGVFLLLLSILLLVNGILRGRKQASDGDTRAASENQAKSKYLRVLATLGLIVLFAFMLKPAGFCVSCMVYLFLQMLLLMKHQQRSGKRILITLLIAVVASVCLTLLFVQVLKVALPVGVTAFMY